MKLHLPLILRKSLLLVCAATITPAWSAGLHEDIAKQTYADFGQNKGRFRVTGISSMLQAIRDRDGGIAITTADGNVTCVLPEEQGMINFANSVDYGPNGTQCHGAGAAFGANYIVTVAHNPPYSASFGVTQLGSDHTIKYSTIAITEKDMGSAADWGLYRQNKIFTDVVGAANYSGVTSEKQDNNDNGIPDIKEQLEGTHMFTAGGGNVRVWKENGGLVDAGSPYTTILGGISFIRAIAITTEGLIFVDWNMKPGSSWVTESSPLPTNCQGGDSGSPVYVYNKEAGRYEYLFSHRASNDTTYSVGHGSIDYANQIQAMHSVEVDMRTSDTAYLNSVSAGSGTIQLGETTISHLAVNSGTNTWKNLADVKDKDNWYAYGNNYQNGIGGLGSTQNLIFTGNGSNDQHNIILNATVDTGVGYLEFSNGKFTIASADSGSYMLNSAGYVINEGAEVHVQLTNPADYMREWRKNGAGDLYIEGEGNNNILLAVGGSGTTYLNREDGYAAYNVLASSGATVVIKDKNQIARDFTFGLNGGTLDMNGVSMDWFTTNDNISAEGFSINSLTDDAVITNSNGSTTLTYTQSGNSVWKGSLKDTATGSLSVIADMGAESEWRMNSICTDLGNNAASSFAVKSGTVVLEGVNTEHGTGSVPYSDDILFSEDDWHYADAKMHVTVENGAQFRLGTHARLTGNVTVQSGGTYVMNEAVHHRMEYIEGGVIKEDTSLWSDYYGHHGDTQLAGGTLQVEFSDKTTATHNYDGNITGTGTVTVNAADSILLLTGDNNFTGSRSVIGGTLMVEDAAAAGNEKWVVEEKGIFAAKEADGDTALSYIASSSSGVLALTQDQNTQINTANHENLIIGALANRTIQYGTYDTTEKLQAVNNAWRLGGGSGNLVVNYHLTGNNTLVLGNAHAKGVVTLTNTRNDFTGGIDFAGAGVTLEYTSEDVIKNVTMNLRYGNRIAMSDLISNITADSNGILLLNRGNQDIDLSNHQSLALSAKEDMNYSGKINLADNQAYRFSAADGTFAIDSEISGNHDIIVDAQGYTNGTVLLNNLNNYTGNITVMGHSSDQTTVTGGNITLSLSQNNALNNAGAITLKSGSTLNIGSTTQRFNNLQLEEGSSLVGDYSINNTDPIASEIHLTIDSFSDIKGNISVESIHKYGNSTLELDNTPTSKGNIQYRYLTIQEGDVKLAVQDTATGNINIRSNKLDLNGYTLMKGAIAAEDGAVIDATKVGSGIGGFAIITAIDGTVTMNNGGNNVTLAGLVGASNGATLKLTGSGNWNLSFYSYNTSTGTLRIEDATQLDFTYGSLSQGAYYSAFRTVSGVLDLDSGIQTLQAASDSVTQHMTFDTVKLNGQNLTLKEKSKSATWIIRNLDSGGSTDSVLTWEASKSNNVTYLDRTDGATYITVTNASRLILNGDNEFTGTVNAKRTANGTGYSTFVELAHNNALKNATLNMQSISGSTISLAVNTDNAEIVGLTGDEYSYAYSGASSDIKLNSAPTGDGKNTLTITGSGTYDYKGAVNGLNLAMAGSGTQQFSGSNINARSISALAGRLVFTHAPTVTETINLAQGATLKLGETYSLNNGVTLAMIAGQSGTQGTLEGNLVLNGGTLQFDGTVLNATTPLLAANISFGDDFTLQTISFSDPNKLQLGATYSLLSGDWSGKSAELADNMPDYLQGSKFTANSDGLSVRIGLASDFTEWQNDYAVFNSANTVLFRDENPSKSLNFTQATTTDGLRFCNSSTYTFSGSDVTLTEALNIESGKLVLNNKLTAANYTSTAGELELGANGVLELTATQDSTATVNNISGTGTLQLKLDTSNNTYNNTLAVDTDFKGTTHVKQGNLTLTGSTFGNTLKLADGVNAQITAPTTIIGNLELDGKSEIHQDSGNSLTIKGNVSGNNGTWVRKGDGTLNLNGDVSLAAFDTESDNTTSNFNAATNISTVTLDQADVTANFNGNATVDTLNPSGSNVTIGGSGQLSVGNFNLTADKSITIDSLSITESSAQSRSWGNNTVNLKNGAVLDTRKSYYNHTSGTLTIGGSEANGTMYVDGLCLMPTDNGSAKSILNISQGAHLIIAGDTSGTTASDFVLAVGGEKSQLMAGSNQINIAGTLTSHADMTLFYKSADVTIANGGRLNLLGGLELKGSAYNQWVNGGVKATLTVQDGGQLYAAGGVNRSELLVTLATGSTLGAIGAAGSTVAFTNNMTLGTDGATGTITIDTAATTTNDNLLLTRSDDAGVTVNMTGNLNLKGNTALEVVGNGTFNHKSAFNNATAIRVQEGATLAVNFGAALTTLTELNKSSLSLNSATVSAPSIDITDSATIHASGGSNTITADTTLTNEATISYQVDEGAQLISSGNLTADTTRGSLIKLGTGSLQLNNANNALINISAIDGDLLVHGTSAYDLNNLKIAASANLSFFVGEIGDTAAEADVRVNGVAEFDAGATLNANLILTTGSSLEVAEGGLAMGSTITLQEGITLGDSTLNRVRDLSVGEFTTIFTGVDSLTLGDREYTSITKNDSVLASTFFSNLDSNNYLITYNEAEFGSLNITMISDAIPEPTTATLSLLALAALTARRRRK